MSITSNVSNESPPDMTFSRDPGNLNDHVKVVFEDVIGEPEGLYSRKCVWSNSFQWFERCRNCCYGLLTLFCGIPMAACWGLQFAVVAFVHVWHVTPCLKLYAMQCECLQKFYGAFLQCFCQPVCEAMGAFFTNIRVTHVSNIVSRD